VSAIGGATRKHRPHYARWRAGTLIGIHVLIGLHIAHWKISGRTLAPLELNEVMYTLELGIVTAGFLFMITAVLATAIFGRFFCSWGCHILALQDLSAWLLRKVRIKPVAIRSRVLLLVPLVAVLYMFAWPTIVRLWYGLPMPQMRVATDAEGWASFTTENFWRNLPSPGVIALTFLVVGFLIVYVLGSRSFCRYGCPYGAVFGLADRIAPGRIRLTKDCAQCGTCTAVCQSHIRVHEELNRYGTVVNPACLKDLDCVAACPNEAVKFGFGLPSLVTSVRDDVPIKKRYDFFWAEEGLMVGVFVVVLLIYRGLYDLIPFLMALALAGIVAYLSVVSLRLFLREQASLNRWTIKREGRLTRSGRVVSAIVVLFLVFTVHSGVVRYHAYQGQSLAAAVVTGSAVDAAKAETAIDHLTTTIKWGLLPSERAERALIDVHKSLGEWPQAEQWLNQRLRQGRADAWTFEKLAVVLAAQERWTEAVDAARQAVAMQPVRADAHYRIAGWCFHAQRWSEAIEHLEKAIQIQPDFPEAHFDLGALRIRMGDLAGGIDNLQQAVQLRADFAEAHYNLAVALMMSGRGNQALHHAATAVRLDPDDSQAASLYHMLRNNDYPEEY
jgi:polyferredoxin/Tfp pilus assembly protein PilF